MPRAHREASKHIIVVIMKDVMILTIIWCLNKAELDGYGGGTLLGGKCFNSNFRRVDKSSVSDAAWNAHTDLDGGRDLQRYCATSRRRCVQTSARCGGA